MDINKKLLEEINRFKMMSSYQPGKLMTEQKILNEKTSFYGKTYVYYNSIPNAIDGVTIGYIHDETKTFYPNKNGEKLFDFRKDTPYKINGTDENFNSKWNFFTNEHLFMFDYEMDDAVAYMQNKNKEVRQILNDVGAADWRGGDSGSLIFVSHLTPAAANIKGPDTLDSRRIKYWNLLFAEMKQYKGRYDRPPKGTPPSVSSVTIEDKFIINGARKTFCDNVVDVDLTNKDNLSELNNIVKKISDYITAPNDDQGNTALSKFKMTIMGQADSAAPGWAPGPPCDQRTRDIGHNYGGMERKPRSERTDDDLHKMNMYLATMRARNYKNLIIQEVKKSTGLDIKIDELPAKEYYGEGDSKRGSEWRSMVLTPTAPVHTFSDKINIDKKNGTDPNNIDYEEIKKAGFERTKTVLRTHDQSYPFKEFNTVTKGNDTYVLAIPENLKYLSKYGPNEYSISKASAKLSEGNFEFIIDTNDGNTYKFKPVVGRQAGDASEVISNDSILGKFNCKASGVPSGIGINEKGEEVDYQFASFVTDLGGKPYDDNLDMYDESSQVTINNNTYYKVVGYGFQLVGVGCQAEDNIPWPTEETIKSLKYFQQPKEYSDKDLEKIRKSIEDKTAKMPKIKPTKNTKTKNRDRDLEDIQSDINDY